MNTNQKNQSNSELQSRPEQLGTAEQVTQNPYVNFRQREFNRQMPTEKVLSALRRWMPNQYELAEVVGQWVWIQFKKIPVKQVRLELSELGFHWNSKRQAWQHPCGQVGKGGSSEDPRTKYEHRFAAATRQ